MTEPNSAAHRIGATLTEAMQSQGLSVRQLAELTGKETHHIEAVLAGYPNTTKRPTELDTVDEIARALGLKLDVVPNDLEARSGRL